MKDLKSYCITETPLVLTTPIGLSSKSKERICEILFELSSDDTRYISKLALMNTAPLALAANGLNSGIVVDAGDNFT